MSRRSFDDPAPIGMNSGELIVSPEPVVVTTVLGTCVAVCLYAEGKGVGGINHYNLPSRKLSGYSHPASEISNGLKFGDEAIVHLIEEVSQLAQMSPKDLKAKIVGGAIVIANSPMGEKIGELNIRIAEETLAKYGVSVVGRDTGGSRGRKILFHTATGRLQVSYTGGERERGPSTEPGQKKEISKIRVMIIDDSRLIGDLLRRVFSTDPGLEVVGVAENPIQAMAMIPRLKPDVLSLDIHMPEMDGVTFLERYLPKRPIPTVVITSLNIDESHHVLRALELGAVDYIQKPSLKELSALAPVICEKIRMAAGVRVRLRRKPVPAPLPVQSGNRSGLDTSGVVAIGASTGGTEAIKDVLIRLPKEMPPILIVQHIPPVFSAAFAHRLNSLCAFPVKEARDGMMVERGQAVIAPGDAHMTIERARNGELRLRVFDAPKVNGHRPSVDVLFHSVAEVMGKKAIGVLLTGMGRDGAAGLLKMRQTGARTIAQDEESSVVFGMPREAIKLGAAELIKSLDQVSGSILQLLTGSARKTAA